MSARGNVADLTFWITGVLEGAAALSAPQREKLFRSCARACLAEGTMDFYGTLFESANGDFDAFFCALGETEGVQTHMVEPGCRWDLVFETCSCPLVANGCTADARLCGCSRQSVLYALHELWPDERFSAELAGTVLSGATCCTLHVERKLPGSSLR